MDNYNTLFDTDLAEHDAMLDLERKRSAMGWISVKDKMPKEEADERLIINDDGELDSEAFTASDEVIVARRTSDGRYTVTSDSTMDGCWLNVRGVPGKVTHWREFPVMPTL